MIGLNACVSIKNLGLYMTQTSYKKLRTRHPKVQRTHFSFAVSCLSNMCMELFFLRPTLQKLACVSKHSMCGFLAPPESGKGECHCQPVVSSPGGRHQDLQDNVEGRLDLCRGPGRVKQYGLTFQLRKPQEEVEPKLDLAGGESRAESR